MSNNWVVGPLLAVGLTGCSTVLASQAAAELEANCAEQGLQFVETAREMNELLIVSSASVSGVCVDPDDPRYVTPAEQPTD